MALSFLALLAITIALTVAQRLLGVLLKPKDKGPKDWTQPDSAEGSPIPSVFGTAEIASNVVFLGNVEIRKHKGAFRYYAAMHHVFCWGVVNEIIDFNWDDVSARNIPSKWPGRFGPGPFQFDLPYDGPTLNPGTQVTIEIKGDPAPDSDDSPALFGGNKQGGGVAGRIVLYWGFDDQQIDAYLDSVHGYGVGMASSWPRVCYARFSRADDVGPFYVGANSAALRPMRAVLRCTTWWGVTGLSPLGQSIAEATIRYDANPMEILWTLFTDPVKGLGRPAADMDLASFTACAVSLRNEVITPTKTGFGLSVVVNTPIEADQVIRRILDHIDAVIYTDPATGLLTAKLVRGDYSLGSLKAITKANSWDFKYSPASWSELVNEVRVTYPEFVDTTERRGFVDGIASAFDQALFQTTDTIKTVTTDFPYATDRDIAQLIAERERKARGVPLARCSWTMNREGYALRKGDVVIADQAAFGVANLVIRILSISYGTPENGEIHIEGLQDIFSVSEAVYGAPADSTWVEPPGNTVPDPDGDDGYPVTWGTHFDDGL